MYSNLAGVSKLEGLQHVKGYDNNDMLKHFVLHFRLVQTSAKSTEPSPIGFGGQCQFNNFKMVSVYLSLLDEQM